MMREGRKGEDAALHFLSMFQSDQITDVRDDPYWRERDVDFLLHKSSGAVVKLETKSDRHIAQTGNVLFELMRIHHTAGHEHCAYLGWSVFTEAHHLLVWCPPANRMYVFGVADLRRAMQAYTRKTRQFARLKVVTTDTARTTINVLIPLRLVPHKVYTRADKTGVWRTIQEKD